MRQVNGRAAGLNLMVSLRNDAEKATENRCAYMIGIIAGSITTLPPPLDQTHSEMVTSGNLSLLGNNAIKSQLENYYNSYQDLEDSMPSIDQRISPLSVMFRNHTPVKLG